MSQESLPGMPQPPDRPARRAPEGLRLARFTGNRRLCDRCVRDIHRLGVGVAPFPMPARWRARSSSIDEFLCTRHKEEL